MIALHPMLCAYCCRTRLWPQDFPLAVEAKCRHCIRADEEAARPWTRFRAWLARAFGRTA